MAVFVGYSVACTQTSDIIGDICILEARVVWRVMRIWNKFVKKKKKQNKRNNQLIQLINPLWPSNNVPN